MAKKNSIKQKIYTHSKNPFVIWLREIKGLSPNTIYLYHWHLKKFLEKGDVTQEIINDYASKNKNNSVVRGFLKAFLEYAKLEKQFELPIKKSGRTKQKKIRSYTNGQIQTLLDYAYEKDEITGLVLDIIYHGALRISELPQIMITDFMWNDYLSNQNQCRLQILGKGKKERVVLIPQKSMNRILKIMLKRAIISKTMNFKELTQTLNNLNIPLFPDRIYEWRIWKSLKDYSKVCLGIEMRPHELRHTRATYLLRNGASIRSIQIYLGHSSLAITEIYLHTSQDEALEEIEKIK